MKRFLSTILTIVFVVSLFAGCDSDLEDVGNDPLESSGFDVAIEIECVENWIFSKYDVDVYVEDSFEGTIAHGDTKTFNLHLDKGTYALRFISAENDDLTGEATLHIHKDESLKYKISCNSSGIDVDTIVGTTPPNDDANGGTETGYTLDYADAAAFEAALNNGEKVNGKVVQFVVNSYKPDSALGINCWSGEHLNFISKNKLDVVAGDIIVGYITQEPSKILGSWSIHYEPLLINDEKTGASIPSKPEETIPPETTEPAPVQIAMTADASSYVGKNYKDVENELKNLGFENVQLVETKTTDTTKSDGAVESVTVASAAFNKGDTFEKNVKITIKYLKVEEPKLEIVFPQDGTKLAKDFDSKGSSTAYYINVDGTKNKPVLKKWGKATVTDGVAEYLDYLESLGFTVTIVNSSQKEPYSGFTVYETDFKVSKDGFSWTMYLCIQDQDFVEYELDIHLK